MKANGLARIGKDAEVRYTPGGAAVANVSLAFTYGKKATMASGQRSGSTPRCGASGWNRSRRT